MPPSLSPDYEGTDKQTITEALDRHEEYYFDFTIFLASDIYDKIKPTDQQALGRERIIQSPKSQLCGRIRDLL